MAPLENAGSVGRTAFQNLGRGGFTGVVYPVNPKRSSVLLRERYPSIADVPEKSGFGAYLHSGADGVAIRDCVMGVSGAIIISAGFKEIGEAGVKLEAENPHGSPRGPRASWVRTASASRIPCTGFERHLCHHHCAPRLGEFPSQSGSNT